MKVGLARRGGTGGSSAPVAGPRFGAMESVLPVAFSPIRSVPLAAGAYDQRAVSPRTVRPSLAQVAAR